MNHRIFNGDYMLKEYFSKLRHDPDHHLGLGDIRITIGMQEEILRMCNTEQYITATDNQDEEGKT